MKKPVLRLLFVALLILAGGRAYGQTRTMDIPRCKALIAACDSIYIQPAQYDFMVGQCRILADQYLAETARIKKISDKDARKEAANRVNSNLGAEYNIYERLIRILKAAMKDDDAVQSMGRERAVEVQHLLNDNWYINQMFTVYRSRY